MEETADGDSDANGPFPNVSFRVALSTKTAYSNVIFSGEQKTQNT